MELNYILVWIAGLASASILFRASRGRQAARGWSAASAIVLAVTLGGIVLFPRAAGYAGGGLWLLLIFLPMLLSRAVAGLVVRQRFGLARLVAQAARILHPADGWGEQPHLVGALERMHAGAFAEAEAILARHGSPETPVGRAAELQRFRMNADWAGLVAWVRALPPGAARRDPNVVTSYLRALGELGDLEGLALAYADLAPAVEGQPLAGSLARLHLAAFAGRPDLAARLLGGALARYPAPVRAFWLGTAELAAGREAEGRAALERARLAADPLTRRAIDRRLAAPPPPALVAAGPAARAVVGALERALDEEDRFGHAAPAAAPRPLATRALIVANLVFYLLEVQKGGATSDWTLRRLGALVPAVVLRGEWWRVLAAMFLHFGAIHIAMNMAALHVLGPFVERSLGRLRYLVAYFGAGVASMLFVVWLATIGRIPREEILVGASGAIMGLVGATAALLLHGWRRERAWLARRRLAGVGAVIVLQTIFDLTTPQVSFAAHASGAVAGFAIGSLLARRRPRR